ncbi:MAG: hypothetical protein R3B70_19895 [Polyangiaceae bacterium]
MDSAGHLGEIEGDGDDLACLDFEGGRGAALVAFELGDDGVFAGGEGELAGGAAAGAEVFSVEIESRAGRGGDHVEDGDVGGEAGDGGLGVGLLLGVGLAVCGVDIIAVGVGVAPHRLVSAGDVEEDVAIGDKAVGVEEMDKGAAVIALGEVLEAEVKVDVGLVGGAVGEGGGRERVDREQREERGLGLEGSTRERRARGSAPGGVIACSEGRRGAEGEGRPRFGARACEGGCGAGGGGLGGGGLDLDLGGDSACLGDDDRTVFSAPAAVTWTLWTLPMVPVISRRPSVTGWPCRRRPRWRLSGG